MTMYLGPSDNYGRISGSDREVQKKNMSHPRKTQTKAATIADSQQAAAGSEEAETDWRGKTDLQAATFAQLNRRTNVGTILADRILASRKMEKFSTWAEV